MNIHSILRVIPVNWRGRQPVSDGWLLCRWPRLLLVALIIWSASATAQEQALTPESRLLPAPSIHLQDLEGSYRHLQDYRGRTVIVNFWASWCTPCRRELPSMNRAWSRLQSEGIAMLAINLGEEPEAVKGFLQDFPIDFPVLLDRRGIFSQRWGVRGLPTTFVLNGRGEIVYRVVGDREWDDDNLLQQIRALQTSARSAPLMSRPGAVAGERPDAESGRRP